MKQLTLAEFDLQKVKINSKKGLEIHWFARGNNNDLFTVSSDAAPHEDLFDLLDEFREMFATVNECLDGWNHARDYIKANEEALKSARLGYQEEIERWNVSGIIFKGSGDNEGIVLTGSRRVESGNVRQASPLIKFQGEIGIEDDALKLSDELKAEVWKYLFKFKRGNDLFASQVDEEVAQKESNLVAKVEKQPKKAPKAPQKAGLNVMAQA